jgi:hypothetical protein
MNRRGILCLSAITILAFAVLPGSAVSQQKTLKDQLVGTWTFVLGLQSEGHLGVRQQWPLFTHDYAFRPSHNQREDYSGH